MQEASREGEADYFTMIIYQSRNRVVNKNSEGLS
jgi:hypothetical protein